MRYHNIIVGHDGCVTNVYYHNNTLSCDPSQTIPVDYEQQSPNASCEGIKVIL